jgi:hypothetical protein
VEIQEFEGERGRGRKILKVKACQKKNGKTNPFADMH